MKARHLLRAVRRRVPALLVLGTCVALTASSRWHTRGAAVDGVYTRQQAERGRVQYDNACASCHGTRLEGGTSTPLAGEAFIASWSSPRLTLDDFYYIVRKTMPKATPGSLDRKTYEDIVAFILQENGFPPGEQEFIADPALMKKVRFGTPSPGF